MKRRATSSRREIREPGFREQGLEQSGPATRVRNQTRARTTHARPIRHSLVASRPVDRHMDRLLHWSRSRSSIGGSLRHLDLAAAHPHVGGFRSAGPHSDFKCLRQHINGCFAVVQPSKLSAGTLDSPPYMSKSFLGDILSKY